MEKKNLIDLNETIGRRKLNNQSLSRQFVKKTTHVLHSLIDTLVVFIVLSFFS